MGKGPIRQEVKAGGAGRVRSGHSREKDIILTEMAAKAPSSDWKKVTINVRGSKKRVGIFKIITPDAKSGVKGKARKPSLGKGGGLPSWGNH